MAFETIKGQTGAMASTRRSSVHSLSKTARRCCDGPCLSARLSLPRQATEDTSSCRSPSLASCRLLTPTNATHTGTMRPARRSSGLAAALLSAMVLVAASPAGTWSLPLCLCPCADPAPQVALQHGQARVTALRAHNARKGHVISLPCKCSLGRRGTDPFPRPRLFVLPRFHPLCATPRSPRLCGRQTTGPRCGIEQRPVAAATRSRRSAVAVAVVVVHGAAIVGGRRGRGVRL